MQHAPDASPGLLRRRYSVPETVMRKYRLAQQRSESEGSAPASGGWAASASPAARALRRSAACCCRAQSASPRARRARDLRAVCRPRPSHAYSTSPSTPDVSRSPLRVLSHAFAHDQSDTSLCTSVNTPAANSDVLLRDQNKTNELDKFDTAGLLPYDKPLTVETTPTYDVLEIVVSEMLDANLDPPVNAHLHPSDRLRPRPLKAPPGDRKSAQNINIDEYVSNILVESLNSLTDQLECMNASMGSDRKISIVEKEIKVKLQNAGVNTIVHLSPTSNNQIIFGNEELCNDEGRRDACNNNSLTIREETLSVESNNNATSADTPQCPCDSFDIHHDNVNQAVLQQIQKLFQDELHAAGSNEALTSNMPEISHIEISNVDVYIDDAPRDDERSPDEEAPRGHEVIGAVGAGNYFPPASDNPVVPRFSALPHTDSMEVNTSSSDDADFIGSDCTSLVDSLDDPNSPRSVLMRRVYSGKRGELVRSAIDVLDLLPENVRNEETPPPRDKPESFFIGIKDNECDCDKENVNVADRMPEKIKQRLYRRHRSRERRMESARRTPQLAPARARPHLERDCRAIVNALIDDVIAKIAQDEYKCMRIKRRPTRMPHSKSDENVTTIKRSWRKNLEPLDGREPFKAIKNDSARFDTKEKRERHQVYGKLSLRPPPLTNDRAAKRIYQKSEIHDGNKCIEILEILEYVNGSQSSPEVASSDENQNLCTKIKKSRIPVLIPERSHKSHNADNNKKWSSSNSNGVEANGNTNKFIANMLLEALAEHNRAPSSRRVSVPAQAEPRERANSLRFRQMFDMIPEERSSLSLDSGTEEGAHYRRASAPDIVDEYREPSERECDAVPHEASPQKRHDHRSIDGERTSTLSPPNKVKATCNVATSPMSDGKKRSLRSRHQTTMTSPSIKSASTSPAPPAPAPAPGSAPARTHARSTAHSPRRTHHTPRTAVSTYM